MTKSHRDYPTFVPATVDGEVMGRQEAPQTPVAYQPIQGSIQPQTERRAALRQTETIKSTPTERAHAFTIRTRSISMMTGGAGAFIWFMVRWALPLTTGATTAGVLVVGAASIVFGLLAFLSVWSGAYVLDMATSPGGVDFFESWRTQRRIDRQSEAMIDAYRKQNGIEK